jgi:hypothetical protein
MMDIDDPLGFRPWPGWRRAFFVAWPFAPALREALAIRSKFGI